MGVGGGGCQAVHRISQRHTNTRQLDWMVLDTDEEVSAATCGAVQLLNTGLPTPPPLTPPP